MKKSMNHVKVIKKIKIALRNLENEIPKEKLLTEREEIKV